MSTSKLKKRVVSQTYFSLLKLKNNHRCSPKVPCPPLLDESVWQTGQHSPSGMTTFSQLVSSSHWISSQRTWPLSQTQIRHGSGFQMSLLVYTWPSAVQLTSSPETHRGINFVSIIQWWFAKPALTIFLVHALKGTQSKMYLLLECSDSVWGNVSIKLLLNFSCIFKQSRSVKLV